MADTNPIIDRVASVKYTKSAPLGLTRERRGWYTPNDDYLIGIEFLDTATDLGELRAHVNETAKLTISHWGRRIVRFYDDVPAALAFIDRFADKIETVVRDTALTLDNEPSADRRRAARQRISDYQESEYQRRREEAENKAKADARPSFDTRAGVIYTARSIGDASLSAVTPAIVLCGMDNKPMALKRLGAVEVKTWRGSYQRVAFFPSERVATEALASIGDVRTVMRYQTDGLSAEVLIPWQDGFERGWRQDGSPAMDSASPAVLSVLEACGDAEIVSSGILMDRHDATLCKIAHPELAQVDLV